jgi:hypothetical protein
MVSSKIPEMDMSLESWIYNARVILQFPITILTIVTLLVGGTFVEIAPRKSLEFLDTQLGRAIFFVITLFIAYSLDWATGLLAAVVFLVTITRLERNEIEEGFTDSQDSDTDQSTKIISNSHRWFVEKILGEHPIAISSDRIRTSVVQDENQRTSTSSSLSTSSTSGSSSQSQSQSLADQFSSSSSGK